MRWGYGRLLVAAAAAFVPMLSGPAQAETVIQVSTSAQLSSALATVPDGGVIELLSGTFNSPSSGFVVLDPGRGFTIRAQSPGSAILDGQGTNLIFDLQATSPLNAGWVSFEGLVFRNGFSANDVRAAGVTVNSARASFTDCVFDSNHSDPSPSTGGTGAGTGVIDGSLAIFNRCIWRENTAITFAAGLLVGGDSTAYIHDSEFIDNRTDIAGHRPTSSGAGLNVRSATVWVTNTRFDGNTTGFAGGGFKISAPFTGPAAFAVVANCTFVDNRAENHPSVTAPSPPAGGGMMVEALADVYVYNSRFLNNSAVLGGGISTYRSLVHIHSSIFRGNEAYSTADDPGRGGAIKASSSDVASDGNTNHRSAELLIRDSFFQGRYNGVGATAQNGGCIYAAGDTNRMYGQAGVSQMGTLAQNRAGIDIQDSAFVDCDAAEFLVGNIVVGGGIAGNLVDLEAADSTFTDCDAPGSLGRGGAGYFAAESLARFDGSVFVGNTAGDQGGGLRMSGSEIQVDGCDFARNEVSPGVSEPENQSRGASIYSTPNVTGGVDATGLVRNSTFSSNIGMTIHDDDRIDSVGVFNHVRYNANAFFESTFANRAYRNTVEGGTGHTAAELNALVVDRGNGNTTDKSPQSNNSAAGSAPVFGRLLAAPPATIDAVAAGDPASSTESFLVYAYSGGSATLDGSPVSGGRGFTAGDVGPHELTVGGTDFPISITRAGLPEGTLMIDPPFISSGEQTSLSWSTNGGSFLNSVMDWNVETGGAATGNLVLSPPDTRTYALNLVTEEGGIQLPATVYVDEDTGATFIIFIDGFETGDTGAWTSSSP